MVILAAFAAGVVVDNFIAHFDIGLTIGLNWPGLVWHALNLGALVLVLVVLTWTARAVWRLRRGRQG